MEREKKAEREEGREGRKKTRVQGRGKETGKKLEGKRGVQRKEES